MAPQDSLELNLLSRFSTDALRAFARHQQRPVTTLRDGYMHDRKLLGKDEQRVIAKAIKLDNAYKSIRHLTEELVVDTLKQLEVVLNRIHCKPVGQWQLPGDVPAADDQLRKQFNIMQSQLEDLQRKEFDTFE